MTDLLYLRDAQLRTASATVTAVDGGGDGPARVSLDRTIFYATGGGQPHDTGTLGGAAIVDVVKEGDEVWHTLEGPAPSVGDAVDLDLDWDRRFALMRTHTMLHILCGVMWNDHGVVVTGGNMEPLSGRLDFEFPEVPEGFKESLETSLNAAVAADHPIEVSFVPRSEAVLDESLIRTKVSLVPESVVEVRVVDIVGFDRQADGGTHVASTSEVGRITVRKVESKGKGFRRIRLELG
jgi:misacylated tRNA(Ala) deacylase